MRFDGWNDQYLYSDPTYYTDFSFREDTNFVTNNTGTDLNLYLKGSGINSAAVMASENTTASNAGITAWAFDMYTPAAIIEPADPDPKHEALQAGLEGYLASANKSLMKFWVTVIIDDNFGASYPATNPYKYFTATTPSFSSYVANLTTDPQYLKIDNRPVIGLYTGGSGPALTLAQWQAFLAPMGGQSGVWVIQMSCSSTDAATFSTQAEFCYGVQNMVGTSGHQAWSVLDTRDRNMWASSLTGGLSRISQLTPDTDPRPLDTSVTTRSWTDQPTEPTWYQHVIDGMSVSNTRMGITIWDELSEEGPGVAPTIQEGSRYLDAIKWARGVSPVPSTYTYEWDLMSLAATTVGTWTYVDPYGGLAVGAHDGDEVSDATTSDSKAVTHPSLIGCGLYARTGPDEGIVEAQVDGVHIANVDLFSASTVHHVNVWNSAALSDATHTCKWIVTGTKNASSTGVTVVLDSAKITYNPSG